MHDNFKLNNLASFNFLTLREVNACELLKWILLFVKFCKSIICISEYYLIKCYKILVDVTMKTFKVNKKCYQNIIFLHGMLSNFNHINIKKGFSQCLHKDI